MGAPQVDKFGTTHLNCSIASGSISLSNGGPGAMNLISTISSGHHQISPRIGILGQHSYKPEERGLTDEATDSVANQVKRIEDNLVLGYDIMNAYKEESSNLRQDIDKLLNALMDKNEDALQEV
jgi:hypothetical protein